MLKRVSILMVVVFLSFHARVSGQAKVKVSSEKKAGELFHEATRELDKKGGYAIYFESIGYGLKHPTEIFDLPVYKIYKGGFVIALGNKFEMKTGYVKGICDGELKVLVDEQSRMMLVDSLRITKLLAKSSQKDMVDKFIPGEFSKMDLKHVGREKLRGTDCHKLKVTYPNLPGVFGLYYITEKSNRLMMIAEYQKGTYDAYLIRNISSVPKKHNFQIKLPDKEISDFHGYEVVDLRFTAEEF